MTRPKPTTPHLTIILLLLILTACAPKEPDEATQIPIARVSITPASAFATATYTAVPTNTTQSQPPTPTTAVRPNTPFPTQTQTAVPIQLPTTYPLPLPPLAPFPTVTPDYRVFPTKPIFLLYGGYGGDGGGPEDYYYGRATPTLIIYGDGQIIIREGNWPDGRTYLETIMTPNEMCALRQQIQNTGFLNPHEEFFTEQDESIGGGDLVFQVESKYYQFNNSHVQYLVDDLAQGVKLIQDFQPQSQLQPYRPEYLILWIRELESYDSDEIESWPEAFPPLSELWLDRTNNELLIEGELVEPILNIFSHQLVDKIFQDGNKIYQIVPRPILPHETPYRFSINPTLPRDYVPVLNCQNGPTLISPDIPTPTPTIPPQTSILTGLGRIVFASGASVYYPNDSEIYISDADGTNRIRLTNNLFADDEPVFSPNGQQITFTSERNGNKDIFVMDANGRNLTQLTDNEADDYSPAWSPDGTKIAFISDRDVGWQKSNIYQILVSGSGETPLTNNDSRSLFPVWSSDGTKIAFVNELSTGQERLAVLHLTSGEIEPVTNFTTNSTSMSRPAWSPNNSVIAVNGTNTIADLKLINIETGEVENIIDPNLTRFESLDWSADGRFIIFSALQTNTGPDAIHYAEYQSYHGSYNLNALDTTTNQIIQITHNQTDETSPSWWP